MTSRGQHSGNVRREHPIRKFARPKMTLRTWRSASGPSVFDLYQGAGAFAKRWGRTARRRFRPAIPTATVVGARESPRELDAQLLACGRRNYRVLDRGDEH